MALVIDTNSYVDVTEADLYFVDRLYSDAWDNTSEPTKEQALLTAMLVLEPLCTWDYSKTDTEQALMFPRGGDTDVPNNVKIAQMEIALEILSQGIVSFTDDAQDTESMKLGSMTIKYFEKNGTPLTVLNSITKSMVSTLGYCSFSASSIQVAPLRR